MKCLIKLFFASSFFCISIVSSFANESEIKTIASAKADARKAIGEIYSCEYKITYSNLENQKAFSSDEVAKKNLPFISLYTTNFTEPLSYQDSAFLKLPKFP